MRTRKLGSERFNPILSRIRVTKRIGAIRFKDGDDTVAGGNSEDLDNEDSAAAARKDDEQLGDTGKKALENERRARKELEQKLAELSQKYKDIDPEEVARMKATAEERERTELEEKKRYDEVINRTKAKHESEITAERALTVKLRSQLEETKIEQAITEAFFAADGKMGGADGVGTKDFAAMLLSQVRSRIAIDDDGDVIVIDSNGDREFNPETAKPMTVEELMNECRTKGATRILFNPIDKAQGGGAYSNVSRKARDQISAELAKLAPSARIARARELGLS